MLKVYCQVLREKVDNLQSLEFRARSYARAERLHRQQVNEISSLLKDIVDVILKITGEAEVLKNGTPVLQTQEDPLPAKP